MTITLDPEWISDISMDAYSVGIGGTISTERYQRYLTIIVNRLSKDGLIEPSGDIKSGLEYLAALLICDIIQTGPITDTGIKSESFEGAYSYTRSESSASSNKSSFMIRYETELESSIFRGKQASSNVIRSDYEIEFSKLSQGNSPRIRDSSSKYPTV